MTAGPGDDTDAMAAAALGVQRALAELRGGRGVELRARGGARAGWPVDGAGAIELLAVEAPHRPVPDGFVHPDGLLHGLIAAERAGALGHPVDTETAGFTLDTTGRDASAVRAALASIAGLSGRPWTLDEIPELAFAAAPGPLPGAALALVRESSLAPALLWRPVAPVAPPGDDAFRVPAVHVDDVRAYPAARGRLIDRVSSAHVPLAGAGRCEFLVYRERFGEAEHVAVVVGEPARDAPVTVRIHSACFTGDLFASMKCDCGEQLRGAVTKLANDGGGGGVILYLAQEGRGIGLANKLRAYSLQGRGMDTIDADRTLGFASDHRDFTVARTMLADLGIDRVRLVTNNPRKIAALEAGGIEVVARIPSVASINPHNAYYLETKRDRAGHLFGPNGLAAVGE